MAPRWTWSVSPYPLFYYSFSLSPPDVAVVVSAGYAFALDIFGEHLVPAGVAVGVVDHYLVTVENLVTKLGFGFTVGGIGIADTFLEYASSLVFVFDVSEEEFGVSVCCFEYVGQGVRPSIGGTLVVFVRMCHLCVFACCSILWIVLAGFPAIAVRQAPRRLRG